MENNKQAKDNFKMPGMRGPRSRQQVEKPKNGKKTMIRLCKYFSSEKLMLLGLISAVIIVVVCSVIAPSLQSNAIDTIASKRFEQLPFILLIMIIVYLINSICNFFQSLISAKLSQRIVKKMRNDLFEKIVELPIQYIDNHSHGDIMSRMTNDVENISNTISQSLSSLVSGVLTIIGTVLIMIWYCWQLALLSCFTVILTILATKYLSGAMRKFYTKRQVILGNLNGTVEEMVTGYKTVVAYNHQNEVKKTFNETSDELTKTGIIAEILGGSMGPVMNVINNIGFVIIAAFGGFFAINNMISIGVISAFIVYAKQFGRPIDEIAQIYGQIQTAIASAERVFDIIDVKSEDKSGSNNMDSLQGIISFEHVNFSYIKGKTVLSDFNLEVPAGHKVALVGATGSGKTTVVNLLMRFYDIDSGSIKIDGVNIKDIDCENLRKNTAIVLQDTVLFSDTIKNNLKYSNENADDEEVINAAKLSNCHNMIMQMKDGYDTVLSEGGHNISQGQRQLLSIGRAVLASPKILILDEATSSVHSRCND
jgi:ATP-binding cassette subfamily B multidrug efflux pump